MTTRVDVLLIHLNYLVGVSYLELDLPVDEESAGFLAQIGHDAMVHAGAAVEVSQHWVRSLRDGVFGAEDEGQGPARLMGYGAAGKEGLG